MPQFSKMQKTIAIISGVLTVCVSTATAGYKLHHMYEDEPHIALAQAEIEQKSEDNMDNFIKYQRQQEIRQYEDDLDELKEKKRDGKADRYDLRKLDRYEKRIKQLERENDPTIQQG